MWATKAAYSYFHSVNDDLLGLILLCFLSGGQIHRAHFDEFYVSYDMPGRRSIEAISFITTGGRRPILYIFSGEIEATL